MKKVYETPSVEVVEFQYRDQVVVASGAACPVTNIHHGTPECVEGTPIFGN